MEKPDENGYVTIQWPSKNVPHGGIFHTRVVEPSHARQTLIKELLDESKINMTLREKALLARKQKEDEERALEARFAHRKPRVRPRTSRRRSMSEIRDSGVFNNEIPYKPPKKGEDREKLKERLADMMAYGEVPEKPAEKVAPARTSLPHKLPTAKEQWNELLTQIRERVEWLAEMEELGHGAEHRELIHDQIAERMRAMDVLGIEDSEISSTRSGFSSVRSHMSTARSNGSIKSNKVYTARSNTSQAKQLPAKGSARQEHRSRELSANVKTAKEENVSAYAKLPPLQYSPRRRV